MYTYLRPCGLTHSVTWQLAPEINEVRESLVLSPQGSLWDWANEGSMQGLAGGYFEMKDSRDILTVEDPSAREPVAYALLCVLV